MCLILIKYIYKYLYKIIPKTVTFIKRVWLQFTDSYEYYKRDSMEVIIVICVWVTIDFSNSEAKYTKGEVMDIYCY